MSDDVSPLVCNVRTRSNRRFKRRSFRVNAASDAGIDNVVERLPDKVVPVLEGPLDSLRSYELVQPGITSWESSLPLDKD
jgi:hypothetical protein